jgi:exodeoxyribonuclease VII small subunit
MENNISFEDNMKHLENIVSELERGDISLEKAVELYGEGVRLSAQCRVQLENARLKITENNIDTSFSEE